MKENDFYVPIIEEGKETSLYILWSVQQECARDVMVIVAVLPGSGHIDTAIWMHYMDANKTAGEETRWQLHKNAACNPQQVLAATPNKTPTVRPPAPYHENYSS